ncbi:MAG: integrase [Acidobacteria bacterium]|nr:MAG: integrase [Acidobacteriota bacterium]
MSIHEVLTAPQSPWQNSYVERLIGSIRRECLDHVIVFHEAGLRRILKDYFEYYEKCRTHLSLEKDAPVSRPVELTFTRAKLPDPRGSLQNRPMRVTSKPA